MGANMRSFGMRRHQIVWPLRRVFRFRYLKKDWRAVPTDRRGKSAVYLSLTWETLGNLAAPLTG